MKTLITGARGQLGQILMRQFAAHEPVGIDLPEIDLSAPSSVNSLAALQPGLVIHAAAMTDVDGCARDPERAMRINGQGTAHVAEACRRTGATLCCISTNEVFDGTLGRPYREDDPTSPANPYGASKLAAEREATARVEHLFIVRIAWLFAPGERNFPAKIIEKADELGRLKVVDDEVSNPTYAPHLAEAIEALVQTRRYGIYHLTNEGFCSRFAFARAILDASGRGHVPVDPISLRNFLRASSPPPFAPLENVRAAALGITLPPWPEALAQYVAEGA